jgi:hypothetical protein
MKCYAVTLWPRGGGATTAAEQGVRGKCRGCRRMGGLVGEWGFLFRIPSPPGIPPVTSLKRHHPWLVICVIALISVLARGQASGADLLWDPPEVAGGSVDSGAILEEELLLRGRDVTRVGSIAGLDLSTYEAVWVTLGVFPYTRPLTLAEGEQLRLYLVGGGALYIEGGDIWGYDPLTPLGTIDGISASADGSGDLSMIVGVAATNGADFSELSAPHSGENQYIDRVYPDEPGAAVVLSHASGSYDVGVMHVGSLSGLGSFRVLGLSFEFGGWGEDRGALLERIVVSLELETLCALVPPTDPTCVVTANGVTVAWQNLAPYSSIEVVRDGTVIGTLPPTVVSYIDPTPAPGTHSYRIIAHEVACTATTSPCTVTVADMEEFRRGDLDLSATLDVTDAILLLGALFVPGSALICPDAGDINDSGSLDIADPLVLLRAIFQGGPPPALPGLETCGPDPTSDALPACSEGCLP